MKKLMIIVAMMVATVTANAQQMFLKPMVGGTLSTFTGDVEENSMRFGVLGGAEFGYFITEQFAATAGAMVSMQGSNFKDNNYYKDQSTTLTYFNIPIMANYYIIPGLAVKAGIQPGFLLSLKAKGSEYYNGKWEDYESTEKEGTKTVDLSIPLGLSYEISDFVIDARYNLGISNINDHGSDKIKNSVIMLTLGYKIPF